MRSAVLQLHGVSRMLTWVELQEFLRLLFADSTRLIIIDKRPPSGSYSDFGVYDLLMETTDPLHFISIELHVTSEVPTQLPEEVRWNPKTKRSMPFLFDRPRAICSSIRGLWCTVIGWLRLSAFSGRNR